MRIEERNKIIINLSAQGLKPSEIENYFLENKETVKITIINNIRRENKELIDEMILTDQVIDEKNKLERAKTKLQDKTNLVNRQLRGINRKASYYEEFVEQLETLVKQTKIKDTGKPKISKFERKAVTCVMLSDTHADEVISKTESAGNEEFNFNIFQKRLRKYESEVISRQLKEKNKYLSIFLLGDIVSGMIHEELYENGEAGKVELFYKTAVVIGKFITNISSYFEEVYIQTKQGNHGRFQKGFKYKRTDENWDNIIYLILRSITESEKIKWNISTEFIDFVNIHGFKIGYMHGDEINHSNISKNYEADLYLQGHTHTANYNAINKFLTNGAFNKGNGWVSKKLSYRAEQQHQVTFTLELDKEKDKYVLDKINFINITDDVDDLDTYNEELKEETLLGGKANYNQNTFEIMFGNYR